MYKMYVAENDERWVKNLRLYMCVRLQSWTEKLELQECSVFGLNWIVSSSGPSSVPGDHMGGVQDLLGPSPGAGRVRDLDEPVSGERHHSTPDWQLLQPVRRASGFS